MRGLLGNLFLALVWAAVTGEFTTANLAFGFVLGFAVLWIAGDISGTGQYTGRVWAAVVLAVVFLMELTASNVQVAYDVLTPGLNAVPMVVGVDLEATGDIEVLLLAVLVTLTPGSVVVEITTDRKRMYVYGMYAGDPRTFRRQIKEVFERRVLAVTR